MLVRNYGMLWCVTVATFEGEVKPCCIKVSLFKRPYNGLLNRETVAHHLNLESDCFASILFVVKRHSVLLPHSYCFLSTQPVEKYSRKSQG